ncbi:MAG: pseudouridine-5'-phosphate glycosidase [Planctomycetota bacterium]|nr:pseudouridine-5'-phosphate glycosidase [Planctomycetota bacterium]
MSLIIHPEIVDAISQGSAVVALESTVLTHGLPRAGDPPMNLKTARDLEDVVRHTGAIPATIGVVRGVLHVGLDASVLAELCADQRAKKLSLRDLGPAAAMGWTGGTTVAATAVLAARAGIRCFATGGIGGVHRGWAESLDISADLAVLATTPMCCVSAGAKELLDLDATLQLLETLGIPCVGHKTSGLPRFTAPADPSRLLPCQMDDFRAIAHAARVHWTLRNSAFLVFQEAPADHALSPEQSARWTAQALAEARATGATGARETPFVLGRIAELSGGQSVAANLALLQSNARLATQIAVSMTHKS